MSTYMTIVLAVLPALLLMVYVYRKDVKEKEPGYLLWKLLRAGVFAALLAMVTEIATDYLVAGLFDQFETYSTAIFGLTEALTVALAEEFWKKFFMKRATWKDPAFDYLFDGIVYGVFTSLSFAALENVLYAFGYGGIEILITRGMLSIPGHMCFGVYMGIFYARARVCHEAGHGVGEYFNNLAAFLLPVTLHTVYDGMLMGGGDDIMLYFYGFVIVLDIVTWILIRHEAKNDLRIR